MPASSTTQRQPSSQNRVVYCINSKCGQRENPSCQNFCQSCGTPLSIKNRYRLVAPLRPLYSSAQAEIFEVEDLGVEAAIGSRYKVLKVLKKNNSTLIRLFEQEADILTKLNHPGIPKISLGDGYFPITVPHRTQLLHCLVMEKVEGDTLQDWVESNGSISSEEALNWLRQLLEILEYLHKNKYFHRDIKPSNIMRRPTGQLVLIDFGTVREMSQTYIIKVSGRGEITCVWSAGYTPEEALRGEAIPQSDFYALGRTFAHLLTGKSPLELSEHPEQFNWRDYAPQVSSSLADWIDYLMAPSPIQRPPNTSYILKHLADKTIETLPSPSGLSLPPQAVTAQSSPTPPWLLCLNFVLFSFVLVTGLLWFQKQQENQWQVFREESSPTQIQKNH